MANEDHAALELAIGNVMLQAALCEFLVKAGIINLAALRAHLDARRVAWQPTVSETALFPLDVLASLLAGQPVPPPPARRH